MLGVQTIGNATLIAYDKYPVISTDPWMGGDHYAYYGSWRLPYDIPENIKENIFKSEYIWFSHGHPDHINHDSLNFFKNNYDNNILTNKLTNYFDKFAFFIEDISLNSITKGVFNFVYKE